ncbi:MAG: efflux RND transporter periplasmic adaptor subunit [Thermoanaerobaculia bacterium]
MSAESETHRADTDSPRGRSRAPLFLILGLLVAVGLAVAGIVPRVRAENELARATVERSIPIVEVAVPKRGAPAEEIVLPGNVQAFADAPIFARTSGYVRRWSADLGARVAKGQVLAEIDSPEVDQQLEQARADVATATANLNLSELTAKRAEELLKTDSIAHQDADNARGDANAKKAMLTAAQANVKRLQELQSFEKVYAPFAGVITARNTDVGQLVDAGGASGAARELFHLAALDTLRVFVNVPQVYSHAARPGADAYLTLAELAGRRFPGKLVRTAGSIDVTSRTLRVEVDLDNRGHELMPGAYAQVHLRLAEGVPTLLVPVSALIFRADGLRIATVGSGNHARLSTIVPGRDFGNEIEVLGGLPPGRQLVDNPPDSLVDGQEVRIAASHPPASGGKEGG